MSGRRAQTRLQTRGVSDFFNGLDFTWDPLFIEGSSYEARLKREGKWQTDHHVPDDDEDADFFNGAQLDCFYNGCPLDDIKIDGPYVRTSGPYVFLHNEYGGVRILTAAEWALVALPKPEIQMMGWGGLTTHKAPDGEKFTVRELYDVLVDYIRRQKRHQWAEGNLSIDHCHFEGLRLHDEGYYTIYWGS
tara:strand:- start:584 stop:1153 length:570 start_codon:yes stop_codon:yes gene_type:complete